MSTLIEEGKVGAFIIHEGPAVQMSRESATVVALGPLSDGEPLCENDTDAEADYRSWREAGYPVDNLPTALLIGAIDAPVSEEGTVYRSTLLCGHAVVSTEAIEALLSLEVPEFENWYLLWASLYQRSAIVGTPAPDNRVSLSTPLEIDAPPAAATYRQAASYTVDATIDVIFEGYLIEAAASEGDVITLTLPPGVINRRYRIVNNKVGQTLLVMPDTEERIYGGVYDNPASAAGTIGYGRMYQGAISPATPAGAYIDLIGIGDGYRVIEIGTIQGGGPDWVVAGP